MAARHFHIFPLLFAVLVSCAGTHHVAPFVASRLIEGVPCFPGKSHQCGPASLAGVLNYWGAQVSPDEIADEIWSQSAGGTLGVDMVSYAKGKNLRVSQYAGNLEDLTTHMDAGHPIIVLVDPGFWFYQENHYQVIVGYSDRGIIAYSETCELETIPAGSFLRSWERTHFWTLLIRPEP